MSGNDQKTMDGGAWNVIAASVPGTSHTDKNIECQDALRYQTHFGLTKKEIWLAVVADGAGSAARAKEAAEFACQWFLGRLVDEVNVENSSDEQELASLTSDFGLQAIAALQKEFRLLIEKNNCALEDYACTLLAAAIGEESAVFYQIGDGAIVYATADAPSEYQLAAFPQTGEYANVTHFVTDATAAEQLSYKCVGERIEQLAMFTDGLQRVALDNVKREPYQPFFQSMFRPMNTVDSAILENELRAFLNSSNINERTDDDKTIVLAARQTVNEF